VSSRIRRASAGDFEHAQSMPVWNFSLPHKAPASNPEPVLPIAWIEIHMRV